MVKCVFNLLFFLREPINWIRIVTDVSMATTFRDLPHHHNLEKNIEWWISGISFYGLRSCFVSAKHTTDWQVRPIPDKCLEMYKLQPKSTCVTGNAAHYNDCAAPCNLIRAPTFSHRAKNDQKLVRSSSRFENNSTTKQPMAKLE